MRGTILLSLGIGWAAVLGAEYLGAQSGLGYIIIYSEQFAYLDRMFVVALIFVFYASISYAIFDRLSRWLLQWTVDTAGGSRGRPRLRQSRRARNQQRRQRSEVKVS